jgi:nucleoside-diphosphate-sugar epimerase
MKVLVTGGAGYIGSILTRMLLEKGFDVTVLDRFFFGQDSLKDIVDQVTLVKDDVRWFKPEVLKGKDAVLDLASLSNDPSGELDSQKTLEINYRGRVRVAQAAKKQGVKRYVLASSCSVYGFQEGVLTEESSLNPLTTYAKASANAEKEILPLADKAFSATVVRQATVYGLSQRMRFDLAINGMVLGFFKNGQIPIMRDGKQWRPFVHVKDTSNAFIKILESKPDQVSGEVFNVGNNDQNVQIFDLAKVVAEAMGLPFKYEWYGSTDTRSYRVSFDKIKTTLKYQTSFTPADGAKEVYNGLKAGAVSGDDPRTITVKWYKNLLDYDAILKNVQLNGVVL